VDDINWDVGLFRRHPENWLGRWYDDPHFLGPYGRTPPLVVDYGQPRRSNDDCSQVRAARDRPGQSARPRSNHDDPRLKSSPNRAHIWSTTRCRTAPILQPSERPSLLFTAAPKKKEIPVSSGNEIRTNAFRPSAESHPSQALMAALRGSALPVGPGHPLLGLSVARLRCSVARCLPDRSVW